MMAQYGSAIDPDQRMKKVASVGGGPAVRPRRDGAGELQELRWQLDRFKSAMDGLSGRYLSQAENLAYRGDTRGASAAYQNAINAAGHPEMALHVASSAHQRLYHGSAEAALDEAIRLSAGSAQTLRAARAAAALGHAQPAQTGYGKAAEEANTRAEAMDVAFAADVDGYPGSADLAFQRAARLSRNAIETLGVAHQAAERNLGRTGGAAAYRALELCRTSREARDIEGFAREWHMPDLERQASAAAEHFAVREQWWRR